MDELHRADGPDTNRSIFSRRFGSVAAGDLMDMGSRANRTGK
jgi:hypothetical protein